MPHFLERQTAVNTYRGNVSLLQCIYLIFDERNQRTNDQREAIMHEPWHLKTNAFSTTGRQQRNGILARKYVGNNLLLSGPKSRKTPMF
jgi:hypothetical protein